MLSLRAGRISRALFLWAASGRWPDATEERKRPAGDIDSSPDLHAGLRYGCAPWIAARSRSAYNCDAGNLEQARMMAESQPQMAGGTVESRDERHLFPMLGATTIVLLIAACKLVVHLYAGHRYGYLGDELYFLACSRHLAWGYVDQPPLIAMIAWAVRNTLGQSLLAIRFLPALAGAVEVVLTALIARELGGRRFAQVLAAITTLTAPGILGSDSFFTMNAFEPLFWMTCAYLVIRIIKTGNESLWLANCYFSRDSSGFPVPLPFFDAQSGRSFHPFDCRPGSVARSWWRPFRSRGIASPQTPTPDRESLPATIAESIRVGPHLRRLDDALAASNSPAPFRNCTEALDPASPSQSHEQAKVSDAILTESPTDARPERTERRTHPCHRRNQAAQSQLGLSANRPTDRIGVRHPHRQRRGSPYSRPSLPAGTGLRWSLLADFSGPYERQPLEYGSVPLRVLRVGHVADPLGPGRHGSIHAPDDWVRCPCRHGRRVALSRMFNRALRGHRWLPTYLSSDNDPLYRFHQWQANLRVLEVTEIKSIPYVPLSHPFVELRR